MDCCAGAVKVRIFISYGRRDAAELAVTLAKWLRSQGHEPWLDVEKGIPIGAPFDIRIEMGVSGSNLLIALLSPWSLRPESFCRNEILFAQAMSIPVIPVRVADVVPPIQIISLNYVDACADPEVGFEKLPPIIEDVARTGRMPLRDWVFTPPNRAWWAAYQPLDFQEELARHGGTFVGREWLFAQIRAWVADPASRLILLTADAGLGKSALAAQMTVRLNVRGVHFCSRSNIESCRPTAWLAGLIYQLAAQFTPYRDRIEQFNPPNWEDPAESLFRTLIADPLRACQAELGVEEPWVLVIDGLDESVAAAGEGLKDLLAHSAERLPDWLCLLVTSRPDQALIATFNIAGVRHHHLDAQHDRNQQDLTAYIARCIERTTAERNIPNRPDTVSRLAELAAGNFLFAKMTLSALSSPDPKTRLTLDAIGALPANLGGLYHTMFAKRFQDRTGYEREVLPLLDCLIAAQGPVPEDVLVKATGLDEHTGHRGLRLLSQFLSRSGANVRVFHQSLAEWLSAPDHSAEFAVSLQNGHLRLADACWEEYQAGAARMSAYSVAHLPIHLAEAGRWQNLLELVTCAELSLLTLWVEGGEGDIGLTCLTGIIGYLEKKHLQAVTSAGLATQVARIYSIRGRYDEAEKWLKHALARTSWLRGRRVRAVALHELGSLYLYRAQWTHARRYYRQALRLCRWGFPVYEDEAAANLIGLATVASMRYRFHAATRLAASAIREAKRGADARHVIAGERLIGAACKALGHYTEAESHIQTATDLAQTCGAYLETAKLVVLHAYLYYDLALLREEMPTKAKNLFQHALAEAERICSLFSILEAKMGLGWCALATGATQEAATFFDGLEAAIPPGRHPELMAGLTLGLAALAHQRGEFDTAAASYERVFELGGEQDNRSSWCKAYVGVGAIHWHLGRREQAQATWRRALRLAGRISHARQELAKHSIRLCQRDPSTVPR